MKLEAAFTAIFYLASVPVLELHNQRSEAVCKSQAASIAKNARLPGGGKISVTFKCERKGGKG